MESKVFYRDSIKTRDLGKGVKRTVLAYNDDLMIVEVEFEAGSAGAPHTHQHVQNTYVKEGVFQFTIEGNVVLVHQGDSISFPSNVEHGTLCIEKGTLLDVFTPKRDDFL